MPRVPRLNMADSIPDPEDRRYRKVVLNDKGKGFINDLEGAVRHGKQTR